MSEILQNENSNLERLKAVASSRVLKSEQSIFERRQKLFSSMCSK